MRKMLAAALLSTIGLFGVSGAALAHDSGPRMSFGFSVGDGYYRGPPPGYYYAPRAYYYQPYGYRPYYRDHWRRDHWHDRGYHRGWDGPRRHWRGDWD